MDEVYYIDRATHTLEKENVYGQKAIDFLYGTSLIQRTLGRCLLHCFAKWAFVSWIYGVLQKLPGSRKKIQPFISAFDVNTQEFLDNPSSYASFNDFFIRKLKPEARPIAQGNDRAVIPADGRYYFFQKVGSDLLFSVKKSTFSLASFLQDQKLATQYEGGSLVLARLCPTDCHRFYFPIDCTPSETKLINGKLFSVNPIATKKNPWIWTANKRTLTVLKSEEFGDVVYSEIGATNVGSIIQTFTPGKRYFKGDEKGYFSFGGSAILMLFKPGKIEFDRDLILPGEKELEIRCLIGQSMGKLQQ